MEKLDQIIRKLCPSNRVKLNPKDIRFVGTGAEGTVYKIDEELCIKIYHAIKKAHSSKVCIINNLAIPFAFVQRCSSREKIILSWNTFLPLLF